MDYYIITARTQEVKLLWCSSNQVNHWTNGNASYGSGKHYFITMKNFCVFVFYSLYHKWMTTALNEEGIILTPSCCSLPPPLRLLGLMGLRLFESKHQFSWLLLVDSGKPVWKVSDLARAVIKADASQIHPSTAYFFHVDTVPLLLSSIHKYRQLSQNIC